MQNYIDHTVTNLSDIELNSGQLKGLTFYLTPHNVNKALTWDDFEEFYRRLCLKYHFQDNGHLDPLSTQDTPIQVHLQ